MQINQDRNPYEGMNLGQMAVERDRILKETAPDLSKIDCFSKTGASGTDEVTLYGKVLPGIDEIAKALAPDAPEKTGPVSSLTMKDYMIPANTGRIAHMSLTYGLAGDARDNYLQALKTFLKEMPEAKFDILTASSSELKDLKGQIKQWADKGEIVNPGRVQLTSANAQLSIWAQDSTLVVGNQVIEQDRIGFPGSGDGKVAGLVAKTSPELEYRRLEGIFIDGGNQLATKDTLFVGSDAIAFMMNDMQRYPRKYETITGKLGIDNPKSMSQEELAKLMMDRTFPHQNVVIIGYKGKQPSFHIDMAITPLGKPDPATGKPVVLVGDPSMAISTLKELKRKAPQKYEAYQAAAHQKVRRSPEKPLDTMVSTVEKDTALQENFDAIAKGLERDGYKVERMPYLGGSNLRNHPWLTYNNAVIDGDNVFIPNFGIDELDKKANDMIEKYGYRPVPIDMTAISSLQGAINCITKVMERTYSA